MYQRCKIALGTVRNTSIKNLHMQEVTFGTIALMLLNSGFSILCMVALKVSSSIALSLITVLEFGSESLGSQFHSILLDPVLGNVNMTITRTIISTLVTDFKTLLCL